MIAEVPEHASQAPVPYPNNESNISLDSILDRLLEVRGSRHGKQVSLLTDEIRHLCAEARKIFLSQPILLELEAPLKV